MSALEDQFHEDRAMRDAAKANFKVDIEHAKASLTGKSMTERFTDRISDGARDVFEQATETAEDHKGILAALVGAILIWFSRGPILELLGLSDDDAADQNGDGSTEYIYREGDPYARERTGEYYD